MNENNNEILEIIQDELFFINIDSEIKSNKLVWNDNLGAENFVKAEYCDKSYNNCIAWWKFNEVGKDLVMFTKDAFIINWIPSLNSMGMSTSCIYLKFSGNILVVAYQDKNIQRVFSLNITNLEVKELYHCSKIGVIINNDYLYIKDYEKNECFSVNLHIPLLEKRIEHEQSLKSNQIYLHTRDGLDKFQNKTL